MCLFYGSFSTIISLFHILSQHFFWGKNVLYLDNLFTHANTRAAIIKIHSYSMLWLIEIGRCFETSIIVCLSFKLFLI